MFPKVQKTWYSKLKEIQTQKSGSWLRYVSQCLLTLHDAIACAVQNVCVMCLDKCCVKLCNPMCMRPSVNTLDSLHIWVFESVFGHCMFRNSFLLTNFHDFYHSVTQGHLGSQLTAGEVGL